MKITKMSSIEQFSSVIKNLKFSYQYIGKDEDDKAMYDYSIIPPITHFVGSEKLHGCFEKNTLVTLANGENIPISKLKENTYVLSYDCKTGKQQVKRVKKVMCKKLDKDWCRLVFDSTTIVCTKDHKIWTKNRGYVQAKNLKSTDIFETIS